MIALLRGACLGLAEFEGEVSMKNTATIIMMSSAALALTACGDPKPTASEETVDAVEAPPAGEMGEEGEDGAMMPEATGEAVEAEAEDELGGTSNPIRPSANEEVAE